MKQLITIIAVLSLSGCAVFPLKESNPKQSLNWCPPLPNCVSTEAITPLFHKIKPFELSIPIDEAWPAIREAVAELPRIKIVKEHPGYIYAKSHTLVFKFLDYFEVLAIPGENRLAVRSSSLLGISVRDVP